MVYGALGRDPLNIHINVRMIGFLLKLKSSNKLSSNVYQLLFTLKESKDFHFKWLDHIFKICNLIGMNYLLDSKELESSHQCIKLQFKCILQDQFIQSWFSDMNKSSRGQFYGMLKNEFKLELYLLKLLQVNFTWLCKLRTCNMKIPIETGRWVNIPQ
jgi:hypothetical protein